MSIIWILVWCLQAQVNAGYNGDKDTIGEMVNIFGSKRLRSINNDNFIIVADGDGITGKVAANRKFRVLQLLDLLAPRFARTLGSNSVTVKKDTD